MIYDPNDWLLSMTRTLGSYVETTLADPDTDVEMSFPDTRNWKKDTPLARALIHFEQDDISDPVLGFGVPGVDVFTDTDPLNPTTEHAEAAMHLVNFDVGVWTSAEAGGATKRMQLVQALKNMLATASGKVAFNTATQGLYAVSFEGGRNELDRINDIPVWRALNMTLIVRCFSRHAPAVPDVVALDAYQDQNLKITSSDGTLVPIETP